MKIVIIGCGKVGTALAAGLSGEGHDIVLIDRNDKVIDDVINRYNVMGIVGNGASVVTQQEAGVETADLVIAVTTHDELNMLCCTVAKKLGAKYAACRIRNQEYFEQTDFLRDQLEFDLSINPDRETAKEINALLNIPAALPSESFWQGKANLVEFSVESTLFENAKLSDCGKMGIKFLICAVARGNEVHIPKGDFTLKAGDRIYLIGAIDQLVKLFKKMGIYQTKPRNVMLIGCSRIAYYLTKMLSDLAISVKIIDINLERCEQYAALLPKADIVCGDGTNQNLLEAEGIERMDACVTLTDKDEQNMIISLFAKKCHVTKSICKINGNAFYDLLRDMTVDSAVSPKDITANYILRYARAMTNSFGSDSVNKLYRIVNKQVEAAEFSINEGNALVGVKLKDIRFKPDVLVACIERGGDIIIPSGDDVLNPKDNVIIISKMHLSYINDIYTR